MENWLNINQLRSIEWGLNSNEEKLCSYYSKDHKWVTTKILNSTGTYYCISISKLIQEIPTIGKAKPNFSRALNSLTDKKIFDKQINLNNKKEVYYRFNPFFLKAWKNNNLKICSNINTKNISFVDEKDSYKNGTIKNKKLLSVTEMEQSVTEMEQSVTEMEPISINNNKQSIKQSDKHHKRNDDDLISANKKIKDKNIADDFEKLLKIYPETVNNTREKMKEAFAVYKTFTPIERFNIFKAATNYAKTDNVKNQKSSKYIQSIHTFLTKSYTNFINGIPKNYEITEEFEQKKIEVGGGKEDRTLIVYEQNDIDKIKEYTEKFNKIKSKLKIQKVVKVTENYDYGWVKEIFKEDEIRLIFVKMGGLNNVISFSSLQLAESLVDLIKVENE